MTNEFSLYPSGVIRELMKQIRESQLTMPSSELPASDIAASPSAARAQPTSGAPIVAVMPLQVQGLDLSEHWVAEGIVDDIAAVMSAFRELVVISCNSTRQLRGEDAEPSRVAALLGVQHLVTGTLHMAGALGRLSMALVDARSGALIWSQAFDFESATLFQTQELIAARVAHTLVPHLNGSELQRAQGARPENLDAYHLILQARALMFELERTSFEEAGALLARAIRCDPYYAYAHATLADWYNVRCFHGWSGDMRADSLELLRAAREAVRIDPSDARALSLLAHHLVVFEGRLEHARELIDRADSIAPNDAEAMMWGSPTLTLTGQHDRAVQRATLAMALSPHDPFLFRRHYFLNLACYGAGDYQQAADWGLQSLAVSPNYISNMLVTAAALVGIDEIERARHLAMRHRMLQPAFCVSTLIHRQCSATLDFRKRLGSHLIKAGFPD